MTQAIIFDFDGVLVESVDVKTQAFARIFEPEGGEVVKQIVAYHLMNGGLSRMDKLHYCYSQILRRPLSDAQLNYLCDRFQELVLDGVINAPWVPGAPEILAKCREAGCLLYIVSGTPEEELRTIVEARGIISHFEGIYGSPRNKPEIIRSILLAYQLEPSAVLFIGDSISDYEAARVAGVRFVARADLKKEDGWMGIDVPVIPDLSGLYELLEKERAGQVSSGEIAFESPHLSRRLK